MTKTNKETASKKRRTQVTDLPKGKKELTKDEQKQVKGGSKNVGVEPTNVPHLIRIIE